MTKYHTPLVILSWYTSNICVLLLNKYLLGGYGFKYPVFLTLCHMVACSIMAYAASAAKIFTLQQVQSRKQLGKIVLLAIVFCGSLVLGNASLRFLPVSFTQAVGATTPFFTAFFTLVMLRERETNLVYTSLLPVVVGIAMATGAEPSFNLVGFGAAVGATALRAFKSVLQGILLTDGERLNSLSLLACMSSIAVLLLLPVMLLLEPLAPSTAYRLATSGQWFVPALMLNASLAFFVNLTNFLVTKYTSALTLQVLGNAKGVVAAVISVAIFKNPVSTVGSIGYCITVGGVVAYSQARKVGKAPAHSSKISPAQSQPDSPRGDVESLTPLIPAQPPSGGAAHLELSVPQSVPKWSPFDVLTRLGRRDSDSRSASPSSKRGRGSPAERPARSLLGARD